MESLPADVWLKILQIGVETGRLECTDLCSLAVVNSQFDQMTQDPSLWATLLSRDFPFSFYLFIDREEPSKALYKEEHEMNRIRESFTHENVFLSFSVPRISRIRVLPLSEQEWFPERFQLPPLRRISYRRSSRNNFTQSETQLLSGTEATTVRHGLTLLSQANQPSLRQGRNSYDENKSRKHLNKMSRPKVIPNSKSYKPMNRPPRRSMPRKI